MSNLISRQAVIDAFGDVHPLDYNAQAYLSKIKALPSEEPEIIRCKDCKLFGDPKCLMCFDGYDWADPDGYCHMAERREV